MNNGWFSWRVCFSYARNAFNPPSESQEPKQELAARIYLPGRWTRAKLDRSNGPIAQRLEQATHNRLVVGSNPTGPTNLNMAWAYILRGGSGRHYIGSTTDLNRRLEQHREGHTYSTRRLGETLGLVDALEVGSLMEARELGREMKRKKNPRLAMFLLEQRRRQLGG